MNLHNLLNFVDNWKHKSFCASPFSHPLFNYFTLDSFPQLVKLLKEVPTGIHRPMLPSMGDLTVVHSGFIQSGFILKLSTCIEGSCGDEVLKYDQQKVSQGTTVIQSVSGIGWERPRDRRSKFWSSSNVMNKDSNILWVSKSSSAVSSYLHWCLRHSMIYIRSVGGCEKCSLRSW